MPFEVMRTDASWQGPVGVLQPDPPGILTPSGLRMKVVPRTYIYEEGGTKDIFHPMNGCGYEDVRNTLQQIAIDANGNMVAYHHSEAMYRWIITHHSIPNYVDGRVPMTYNSQSNWRRGHEYITRRTARHMHMRRGQPV